jgi:hypothetical protein
VITYCNIGQPGNRLDIHNLDNPGKIFLESFQIGMPAVREDMSDRPRSQGMDDFTTYFGARTIDMSGVIFSTSLSDLADELDLLKAAFSLWGSAQKQIVFQRLGRSYREFCNIRMSSFDAPLDVPGNSVEWSASLVAADPRIYRRHTPDPATFSFKSNHTVNNTGSGISAPVVVRIVGPAQAGAGVKNATLDVERVFTITRHISRGSVIEVDTGARTVTLNGNRANDILDVDSWFWHLRPGNNHLHRVGKMDGHIEVDWREARI